VTIAAEAVPGFLGQAGGGRSFAGRARVLTGQCGMARHQVALRDSARSVIRFVVPRAVGWLRGKIGSPVRLMKSVFMATIGKDRGFAFRWLVVTAAIALIIGLLVAALVSSVIGIVAALVVGIWMLIRRNHSSQSRKTAQAHLAS
jgi:hypothetical protein